MIKINTNTNEASDVWWEKSLDNCHGSVILLDGNLFGSACRSGGRGFFCADFPTGKVRYRDKKLKKLSLTCADGMLYGLTQRGEMMLINPHPDRLDIVSRFQTPEDSRELAWAHPVVCGSRLYVRRGEYLYAFDVKGKGERGHP